MRRNRLSLLLISLTGLLAIHCGSDSKSPAFDDVDAGAGGAAAGSGGAGTGGRLFTGGATGSGGSTSGGATGSGGSTSGGATGSGGSTTGGATGSGGATSGGATGSGGATSGGATGTGGATSDAGGPDAGPDGSADAGVGSDASAEGGVTSPVVVNEVESNGGSPGDWTELYNTGTVTVDLSGWSFLDGDDAHTPHVIPNGTLLAPGGFFVVEEAAQGFGLGSADSVRLYDGSQNLVATYSWATHAATSYGRCPDGTGDFFTSTNVTKGAPNDCSVAEAGAEGGPGSPAWPGGDSVTTVDGTNVFDGDVSGLTYEPSGSSSPGILWAVHNGNSLLYRLTYSGSLWAPDTANGWGAGKALQYPGGTGTPDSEGVTKAEWSSPDVYVATERNNTSGGVSRLSVLQFDTGATGATLVATREWNLTADLPTVAANAGLEAITWLPDTVLVTAGFYDERLAKIYAPADYANHGTGLFAVGVEANGTLYVYALDHVSGTFDRVATIASGHPAIMGLELDRETGYLWAQCDDTCHGDANVLEIDATGRFVVTATFARPTTLLDINNEGIAIAPEAECAAGMKSFFWSDDNATSGHSLRRDSIPCGNFF